MQSTSGRVDDFNRPGTLTSAIADFIADGIVVNRFTPGEQLSESRLATELSASRSAIREALRSLEGSGLVEVIPHRGVFVTQMTAKKAWEITSLRALLEPFAGRASLTLNSESSEYLDNVEASFKKLEVAAAQGDLREVTAADVSFHRSVYGRCNNDLLLDQLRTIEALSQRIVLTNQLIAADADTLPAQHLPILEAVRGRDPQLLSVRIREHVLQAGQLLMQRMRESGRGEPEPQTCKEELWSELWPS